MNVAIALYGRSGSGKTTIANILTSKYGYGVCSTGSASSKVYKMLFGEGSKALMNHVTGLMREIQKKVANQFGSYDF